MTGKRLQIKPSEMFLFEPQGLVQTTSKLREFIRFIKFISPGKQLDFCFLESRPTFIKKISALNNIVLDARTKANQKKQTNDLAVLLEALDNPFLFYLYKKLPDLNSRPFHYNKEQLKIIALIRCLLKNAQIIMMEHPEYGLSDSSLNDLVRAVDFERKTKGKVILIETESPHLWINQVTKVVTRKKDLRFSVLECEESDYYKENKALMSASLKFHYFKYSEETI